MVLAVVCMVSGLAISAQASLEECQQIYQKFLNERQGTGIPEWTAAIVTGKDYLKKCSSLPDSTEVRDYVTRQIPRLEEKIAQKKIADKEASFNVALKAGNVDELIAIAKELISLNRPYSLDLMLDIASAGFDKASANPANDKYNADALYFAKTALEKMTEGKISGNADKYGFYVEYKNAKCADGKTNAIGWMNYTIGYITHARLKQSKDALPYLYKASQTGCETKNFSEAYRMIGAWYIDEIITLNTFREEKLKANGDKETPETLSNLAMQKGYAERAIDAYSRAYKIAIAPDSKSTQAYKDKLLERVKGLFDFRYDGDLTKLDAYLQNVESTPFVNPVTAVTPVK
jgi:hypothetical protein